MKNSQKAQAGLEYLMTYGWALVMIASVVGVLVFLAAPPAQQVQFSSSEPNKILLKSSAADTTTATAVLQNITGGQMTFESIIPGGATTGCTLESGGTTLAQNDIIKAGATMLLKCNYPGTGAGIATINYKNFATLEQTAIISIGGGTAQLKGLGNPCQQGECGSGLFCCSTQGNICVTQGTCLGAELVTNGTFSSSLVPWAASGTWQYSPMYGGAAKWKDSTQPPSDEKLSQSITALETGAAYKVGFNVASVGGLCPNCRVALGTWSTAIPQSPGPLEYTVAFAGTKEIAFISNGCMSPDSTILIDNVSVKQVLG